MNRTIRFSKFGAMLVTSFGLLLLTSPATLARKKAARPKPASVAAVQQKPQPQPEEENSRRFWPPEFRPAATTPAAKPRTGRYKPVVRPANGGGSITAPSTEPAQSTALGVTLWLLREGNPPPTPTPTPAPVANKTAEAAQGQSRGMKPESKDETARVLVKKKLTTSNNNNSETTVPMFAERIEADTPLKVGQLLRLSVEIPQDGYLYVIDREKYEDGTVSAPFLIYPTNPNSNEHQVKAGRTIELPDSENAFEVKLRSESNNSVLTGELLSFIVTPRPLENLPRPDADGNIQLPETQVKAWEKQWAQNIPVQQLELEKGAGKTRTTSEQSALTEKGKALKQDDPLPQTVFRISVKRGSPFIVQMPLRIDKSK